MLNGNHRLRMFAMIVKLIVLNACLVIHRNSDIDEACATKQKHRFCWLLLK